MRATIGKVYKFEAAHQIPDHQGLCKNVHGHTYTLTIELSGEVDRQIYMLLDFYDLGKKMKTFLDLLDHSMLNSHFEHTTVEFMSNQLADTFQAFYPTFDISIQLQEGEGGYARAERKALK